MTLLLDARQRAMLEEMGVKVWLPTARAVTMAVPIAAITAIISAAMAKPLPRSSRQRIWRTEIPASTKATTSAAMTAMVLVVNRANATAPSETTKAGTARRFHRLCGIRSSWSVDARWSTGDLTTMSTATSEAGAASASVAGSGCTCTRDDKG